MAVAKKRLTVVGVFEDRRHADKAVDELMKAGFTQNQIGVAMRRDEGTTSDDDDDGSQAGTGAVAGALTGLGLGALAGLGVLAGVIPVVGPAIAAGTLGVVLSNAAAGAGIAGLVGALVGAGIPEEEADYYRGEFEAGRTIVTVQADDRIGEATTILRRNGAYDINGRNQEKPEVGGSAKSAVAPPRTTSSKSTRSTAAAASSTHDLDDVDESDTIELKEERLHADKRSVEKGEVKVRKEVRTETKSLEVPVEREEIVIERTPAGGRTKKSTASDFREGEEIRIPIREEEVVVGKESVVAEEVKVGKRTVRDTEHVTGQVRKEELKVETTGDVDVDKRGSGKGPKRS